MKKNNLLFAILLTALAMGCKERTKTNNTPDGKLPALFSRTDQKGTTSSEKDIAFIKGINATGNLRLLNDTFQRYTMPLPDGKEIIIEERRVDREEKATNWYGEVAGEKQSFVSFTFTSKALHGSIRIGKNIYRVAYTGRSTYQISQLDPGKMTEADDDAIVPKYKERPGGNEADACPDPATDIDVMVVYTQAAEDGAGGAEGMEAFIYQCMALTNLSYENSDIAQRMNLVHFQKVSYTEAGDAFDDRAALQDPSDGKMDDVHTLRNTYGADIVALLVETSSGTNCGYAYIMDPVSNAHEAWAFGAIKRSCAVDNLSFPHELGHIMSARHHDDGTTTPYAYGHGYQVLNPADPATTPWRTMMSKIGGTVRVPFFSNPNIQFPLTGATATDAMGTAADEDNHRVLNNTAATVANFRCSSPGINNVWMKDTWSDSGAEPDPATAGEAMYRSPYIWIRNQRDATFQHVHEHDDPEFGSPNWIYVKMHNGGGSAQTGNLEIYIADASLSLTWPGGWTLVATIPLTLNPASTRIVEQEWNSVPDPASGSTHYCMIARWVSATDPMHTAEGPNIGTNVRENNNIVWRNLNVVDLEDDGDSKVVMNVAGAGDRKADRIVWEDITKFPKQKFVATGKVYITIDDRLLGFWKQGGSKSTGLKQSGSVNFEMTAARASLDNLALPKDYKGKIIVTFKRSAQTPKAKFDFSVKHYILFRDSYQLLGGVDYELRNK